MGSFNLNNPGAGIDRRVEKNFPFQSRRPLMERRENFFIENTRERERESLLFSRRRGKKKTACKLTNAILTEFTWCELLDST